MKKVEPVLPDAAPAKPAKPRKVLIFTQALGFVHSSIGLGAKTFELMGKKTGAFDSVTSDEPAMFDPEKLKDFDAVLLVSTTGELFSKEPKEKMEKHRASLVDFVKSGKGLMGIHAAGDCSPGWKEYGEMMGGHFVEHPWQHITAKNEDAKNPVSAAFDGKDFTIDDEIYNFHEDYAYSRDRLHVLLSVDLQKSGIKEDKNRKDHDYGISWLNQYEKGRVFYCALGHREEVYWNPTLLKHYLAGMQFVIGDLPADATPSAKARAAGAW